MNLDFFFFAFKIFKLFLIISYSTTLTKLFLGAILTSVSGAHLNKLSPTFLFFTQISLSLSSSLLSEAKTEKYKDLRALLQLLSALCLKDVVLLSLSLEFMFAVIEEGISFLLFLIFSCC